MVKTHFQCGHPYTEENTVYMKKGKGKGKRRKCRICLRERERNYRTGRREIMRPKQNLYGRTHYAKFPEEIQSAQKKYKNQTRNIVLDHYGATCACCGVNIREFLCVDHINNNGNKHRKEINCGAGSHFYAWLIRNDFPEGYQLLCWNCNMAKAIYGICPHQSRRNQEII